MVLSSARCESIVQVTSTTSSPERRFPLACTVWCYTKRIDMSGFSQRIPSSYGRWYVPVAGTHPSPLSLIMLPMEGRNRRVGRLVKLLPLLLADSRPHIRVLVTVHTVLIIHTSSVIFHMQCQGIKRSNGRLATSTLSRITTTLPHCCTAFGEFKQSCP